VYPDLYVASVGTLKLCVPTCLAVLTAPECIW
jgi:hypothetical protein